MYYVYKLIDPRTKAPFYIGKGMGSRATSHFIEARRSPDKWTNRKKCEHIRSLWDRGLDVLIELEGQNMSEADALTLEMQLIEQHGRLCNGSGILTNIHAHNSPRAITGVPIVAYTITGAIVGSFPSLTAAAQHYNIHKSTICSALNKRSYSAGGVRWFHADEPFAFVPPRMHTVVDQYNYDGACVATYQTVNAAAEVIGIGYTQIVDCCAGRQATAGGFQWAYHGERPIKPVTATIRELGENRELVAYDKQGNVVGVFSSIKEAVASTPANATGISDCHAGRKKTSGGLFWTWRRKDG